MENVQVINRFEGHLLGSDRLGSTINLRMRQVRTLATYVPLVQATTDDLEKVLAARRHLAPETRKSELAAWHLLFDYMRARGIRDDDPTCGLGSVRVPNRVPKVAPDDDIELALSSASSSVRAMILLARYGCLRLSELTTLHTRQREGDLLRIIGKGDKERIVALNEPLMFALHALERDQGHGYYFPGRGCREHMHPMSVNKIITRATGWNPHSLRHAGATAAYNATHDLRAVQEMLGHASLATTQRYLHLDVDGLRRVAVGTLMRERSLVAA